MRKLENLLTSLECGLAKHRTDQVRPRSAHVPNDDDVYPYTDAERRELLPFVPRTASRILDVGCGLGGFSRTVKAGTPGLCAWGIEENPTAAAHAALHLDKVVTGRFPDDMPPDAPQFDTVFFNDVLEHMVDPWAALQAVRPYLAPGGTVVASLPNLRHFTVLNSIIRRADFSYTDIGVLDQTHLRFFTRSTMIEMFTSVGYDVASCTPINMSTSIKARLMSLLPWMSADILAMQYVIVATPRHRTRTIRASPPDAGPNAHCAPAWGCVCEGAPTIVDQPDSYAGVPTPVPTSGNRPEHQVWHRHQPPGRVHTTSW